MLVSKTNKVELGEKVEMSLKLSKMRSAVARCNQRGEKKNESFRCEKLSSPPHSSCLESLRGESGLMTLGNLSCTQSGTGNQGGVGFTQGKVVCIPLYPG